MDRRLWQLRKKQLMQSHSPVGYTYCSLNIFTTLFLSHRCQKPIWNISYQPYKSLTLLRIMEARLWVPLKTLGNILQWCLRSFKGLLIVPRWWLIVPWLPDPIKCFKSGKNGPIEVLFLINDMQTLPQYNHPFISGYIGIYVPKDAQCSKTYSKTIFQFF